MCIGPVNESCERCLASSIHACRSVLGRWAPFAPCRAYISAYISIESHRERPQPAGPHPCSFRSRAMVAESLSRGRWPWLAAVAHARHPTNRARRGASSPSETGLAAPILSRDLPFEGSDTISKEVADEADATFRKGLRGASQKIQKSSESLLTV
jgi:hypothetical protein